MKAFSFHSPFHFIFWSNVYQLPRRFVGRWQFREFSKALFSAYSGVPFYRDLLSKRGITPDLIRSLSDIYHLPVLNKEIYRSYPIEETLNKNIIRKDPYAWNQTSGSTGMPFRYAMSSFYIYHKDYRYLRYSEFCKYRFLAWKGVPLSFIVRDMKVAELGVRYPRPNFRFFPVEEFVKDPELALRGLQKFSPYLLEGPATLILEIGRIYEKNRARYRLNIPCINTHSERLNEGGREFLKTLFGSTVYSRYGVGEVGVVGVECDNRDGLHIHEESLIVEVVDDASKPLPDGEAGRILVSFFYNDVMPFLRYETGDYGAIIPGPCPCGISSRRIRIDGRRGEVILVGGKRIFLFQIELILGYFSREILRFQVLKTGEDSLEIQVIPTSNFPPVLVQALQQKFEAATGISPAIFFVDAIPHSARGKTKIFIDKTENPGY